MCILGFPEYWQTAGLTDWTPTGTPWSAAWVSHMLRGSGFAPSAAHWRYTESVISGESPGWTAYSIPNNIGGVRVEPGDVLIKPRDSGAVGSPEYYRTHGDIVYTVGDGKAVLVGGNLSDRVQVSASLPVDDGGYLTSEGDYLVILKKKAADWPKWLAAGGLLGVGIWMLRNR